MNAVFSIIILIAVIGLIIFLLSRRENTRRSQYGPAGLSEFRTDLPLDGCFVGWWRVRWSRKPPSFSRRHS